MSRPFWLGSPTTKAKQKPMSITSATGWLSVITRNCTFGCRLVSRRFSDATLDETSEQVSTRPGQVLQQPSQTKGSGRAFIHARQCADSMQSNRKMAPRQAIPSVYYVYYSRMRLRIAEPADHATSELGQFRAPSVLCSGLCKGQRVQLPRPARQFPARKPCNLRGAQTSVTCSSASPLPLITSKTAVSRRRHSAQ